ncbi:uncharacterized protein LOC111791465 [Cucurbita pepo subsp. pepo]|uniref:uncharacterized protein LOC111791465 n=1 Tax=Cucurbita pepo subsp. pepo TaxID=3664 RepID=UPI000C9D5B36|nr:uncharacterized protein LOC111791465 [Cucurbita pepo subsp. pepo]XP_023528586.1 uncharacterized protein LOC111791465 [Cucurbita pepo subsp. pepo]
MFRARASFSRFSKRLKQFQTSPFCSKSRIGTNKNSNNGEINGINKVESDFSSYKEAYKQLDNLDFMTASKILFTEPPKKKEFGIDFHLVQLFFVCMPSLAVYLVAQYARYEMRKMEADLELKKKKEEETAKQIKLEEREEIHDKNQELQEVKTRLYKLEETIKEIAVESRKQSGSGIVTKNSEKAQGVDKTKHGANIDPSKSMDDHLGGQKIVPAPVLPKSRASTTGEDSKHQNQGGASSPDSKS